MKLNLIVKTTGVALVFLAQAALADTPPASLLSQKVRFMTHVGPTERDITIGEMADGLNKVAIGGAHGTWDSTGRDIWVFRMQQIDAVTKKQSQMAFVFTQGVITRIASDKVDITQPAVITELMANILAKLPDVVAKEESRFKEKQAVEYSALAQSMLKRQIKKQGEEASMGMTVADLVERFKKQGKTVEVSAEELNGNHVYVKTTTDDGTPIKFMFDEVLGRDDLVEVWGPATLGNGQKIPPGDVYRNYLNKMAH